MTPAMDQMGLHPTPSPPRSSRRESDTPRRVCLALQGGGAHGAFTWGVLDRLLEDDTVDIGAVSAASAGAVNAVLLADGLLHGGRSGARDLLERFWERLPTTSVAVASSPFSWPVLSLLDMASRVVSPYLANPTGWNPLRLLLEQNVDFAALDHPDALSLHLSATRVRDGRVRVFRNRDIAEHGADVVLASACLPTVFQAIEIDGESYWDGGYVDNPALSPLLDGRGDGRDILLVRLNPIERREVPRSAEAISTRLNEISFNANLLREMETLALLSRLADSGHPSIEHVRGLRLHSINGDAVLGSLTAGSKMLPERRLVQRLFRAGREAADVWLRQHQDDIGVRSTCPTFAEFHALP